MKNLLERIVGKKANDLNINTVIHKGQFTCPLCGSKDIAMLPLYVAQAPDIHRYFREYQKNQTILNFFRYETLNIENFACSNCHALDKDRLYALYIRKMLQDNPEKKYNFLDIAPTNQLRSFLKKETRIQYRSMDLYMEDVDDKADITQMGIYKDGQFDFIICSHVLEHVPDDRQAMKELYRITIENGQGIVMVPLNMDIEETIEDPYGTDIAKRWKYFGQDDHVRSYSKNDFISRLESVGFSVQCLDEKFFGHETFNKNAIYPTSVLYIVNKKNA